MTVRAQSLADARKRKAQMEAKLAYTTYQLTCMQSLLVLLLERTGTIIYTEDELEAADARRLVIANPSGTGKWVFGLNQTPDKPLDLDLAARARSIIEKEPANEPR